MSSETRAPEGYANQNSVKRVLLTRNLEIAIYVRAPGYLNAAVNGSLQAQTQHNNMILPEKC
jgi:hypothetical protein